MAFQALRGTADITGERAEQWARMESVVRRIAALYGYSEIRTPIIEPAGLFLRSIGETTDIVQKEMFRFEDRGGNDIVLRPEGTAAVIRAYLENHLDRQGTLTKLFYVGPMFRAERPQAGRFRQFHQCGVEAIGSESPWLDAEVIALCVDWLRACGINDLCVWVGSMGTREDQRRSAEMLRERLSPIRGGLPRHMQDRFDSNIFRILDTKDEEVQTRVRELAPEPFMLSDASREHFDAVRRGLEALDIPFDDTKPFARGLDYYTRTVFEVRAAGLGAQDAVAAGGRYDHLVEELGGSAACAVGFAAGIERIAMAAEAQGAAREPQIRRGAYFIVLDEAARVPVLALSQRLRAHGIAAGMDFAGRSLKAQLREADKLACRFAVIAGAKELAEKVYTVKLLESGGQESVPEGQLADWIRARETGVSKC